MSKLWRALHCKACSRNDLYTCRILVPQILGHASYLMLFFGTVPTQQPCWEAARLVLQGVLRITG